ncbi:MAG: ThiF family adenylyltransferase [Geodermatophilaceae bacterium]
MPEQPDTASAGEPEAVGVPAAPLLNPALRRLWRDDTTVQLGLDTDPAMVIHAVDPAIRALLSHLDGRHSAAEIVAGAVSDGHDAEAVVGLLGELRAAGALLGGDPAGLAGLGGPTEIDRLGPDLASLSLLARIGGPDATTRLRRRRSAQVVVHGATRVGVPLAATVAAAGVGRVGVVDSGSVLLADANPGGLLPADEDRPRRLAAHDALRRAAPTVDTSIAPDHSPNLIVLCDPWPAEQACASLHAAGTPHLLATVRETTGVVGPLVLPGRTACLRCVDLHRCDRDSAWPAMLAQLTGRARRAADPLDGPLALLMAAVAALSVLTFLDGAGGVGGEVPGGVRDASLELRLPDWKLRRRSWPPHPRCRCGAARQARAG